MSNLTPYTSAELSTELSNPCNPDEFLVLRETFAGGAFNAYWNDEVLDASKYSPNNGSQVPFPLAGPLGGAPSGNQYLMNYVYKSGGASDNTPIQVARLDQFTERYVRWNEKYSAGFMWPQSQKLVRMGNGSGAGPTVDFILVMTHGSPNQVLTLLGFDVESQDEMYGSVNCPLSGYLASNTWHTFEAYFRRASAPNVADGQAAFKINGVTVCNRNNVVTHTSNNYPYNFFWLGGNNTWNGNGPGNFTMVPQHQNRYIDNIELFSALPCDVSF